MKLSILDIDLTQRRIFSIEDDFVTYVDTQTWTKALSTGGSAAAGASAYGGQLAIGSSAVANLDNYVRSTNKVFLFGQDQPIIAEARLQFTEANTNQAAVIFGLSSAIAAGGGWLNSTGTGVISSFSGAAIFKKAGTSQWFTVSSLGASQTVTAVNTQDVNGNPSDGNWHTLRVEFQPLTASLAEVRYFVDGLQLRPATTPTATMGIVDQLTFTSAAAMYAGVGLLNGSTSVETLNVDYVVASQIRYATGVSH